MPLKDWKEEWYKGPGGQHVLYGVRKTIALEFINGFNEDSEAFVKSYGDATKNVTSLFKAIRAREQAAVEPAPTSSCTCLFSSDDDSEWDDDPSAFYEALESYERLRTRSRKQQRKRPKYIETPKHIDFSVQAMKVLKDIHSDLHLSPNSRVLMNDILNQTVDAIALTASKVATERSSSIVAGRDLEVAVKQIFPGSLQLLAISAGAKATQSLSTSPKHLILSMDLKEARIHTEKPNEVAPSGPLSAQ
ncbi:hypothetical protein NMY22_g14578 [Coprinellus aureogranulatus]|nr:hypothetical protein NMY22_g14578 [Coprinellus aureogranulatus]